MCFILQRTVSYHLLIFLHFFQRSLDLSKSYHSRYCSSTVFVLFSAFLCFYLKLFNFIN